MVHLLDSRIWQLVMMTGNVTLDINLTAIANNYNIIKSKLSDKVVCGAAVKANAYGLGVHQVVKTLIKENCKYFFVANVKEALEISNYDIEILVLSGFEERFEDEFALNKIIPVLNSLEQIKRYSEFANKQGKKLPAMIHIDTGMNRLGLRVEEFNDLDMPDNIEVLSIISHLACADDKNNIHNQRQLNNFNAIKSNNYKKSFANSSGVFLGKDYHFDIIRPGIALYGGNPTPYADNPMQDVVKLTSDIIQIRQVKKGEIIGYGGSFMAEKDLDVAILPIGYADGFFRYLSNKSSVFIDNQKCRILGRISMDLTAIDITDLDISLQCKVEILGENQKIDDLAGDAGTISYEILTNFGTRFNRNYSDS